MASKAFIRVYRNAPFYEYRQEGGPYWSTNGVHGGKLHFALGSSDQAMSNTSVKNFEIEIRNSWDILGSKQTNRKVSCAEVISGSVTMFLMKIHIGEPPLFAFFLSSFAVAEGARNPGMRRNSLSVANVLG